MTRNIKKRLAASTVLAGCAVILSTPAYGAVAPEPEPPGPAGQPAQSVIDHYLADTTSGTASMGHQSRTFPTEAAQEQPNKAAIERDERAAVGSPVPGVLSAQTKAQVEHLEAQMAQQEAAASSGASGSTSDDDVSAPLVVLALLGGGLIVGAASTYTLRRIRHDGPVSTATA